MANDFKQLQKDVEQQVQQRQMQKDTEGRTVIYMNVKNDDDFLSQFSQSDTPVISSDVADFIENSTTAVPPSEQLTLRISSDCIDKEEQILYNSAIREYYLQKYIANQKEIKRNRILVLLLGIVGILVLTAGILYGYLKGNAVWTEVIDIVAWVLIWEATDIGLFQARSTRIKKKRYLSYLSMKVEYVSSK